MSENGESGKELPEWIPDEIKGCLPEKGMSIVYDRLLYCNDYLTENDSKRLWRLVGNTYENPAVFLFGVQGVFVGARRFNKRTDKKESMDKSKRICSLLDELIPLLQGEHIDEITLLEAAKLLSFSLSKDTSMKGLERFFDLFEPLRLSRQLQTARDYEDTKEKNIFGAKAHTVFAKRLNIMLDSGMKKKNKDIKNRILDITVNAIFGHEFAETGQKFRASKDLSKSQLSK